MSRVKVFPSIFYFILLRFSFCLVFHSSIFNQIGSRLHYTSAAQSFTKEKRNRCICGLLLLCISIVCCCLLFLFGSKQYSVCTQMPDVSCASASHTGRSPKDVNFMCWRKPTREFWKNKLKWHSKIDFLKETFWLNWIFFWLKI
jgi:hypothetical protein